MAENIIPCGGFYYDPLTIQFINIDGKPTMQVIGGVSIDGTDIDLTQFLRTTGGTMTGDITMMEDTTIGNDIACIRFSGQSIEINNNGSPMFTFDSQTNSINAEANKITNLDTPTEYTDAVNKEYADQNKMIFSTEEQAVGKWVNGQILYQRTMQATFLAASSLGTFDVVELPLPVAVKVVKVAGDVAFEDGTVSCLPYTNEDHSGIVQVQATNDATTGLASNIELMNSSTTMGGSVVVTYWYVK